MNLTTRYLGLELANPFLPGASPLVDDLDAVLRLEDAGAPAIVMNSLFEEQITQEELGTLRHIDQHGDSNPEAASFMAPLPPSFFGPEDYLNKLARIRARVSVPVIASLNGTTPGGWLRYARELEQAGASALELNVYDLATDPDESGAAVEERTLDVVREVTRSISIPVAVKLSPFYSSLSHFARRLVQAGAQGLILFNRFYQADIDPDELEVRREIRLSDSSELLLRLRWTAVLSAQLDTPIAVSGGVHKANDAVKAVMAGGQVVQVVAALLRFGPEYLRKLRQDFLNWVEEYGYETLGDLRGCMNLASCPDPKAYERANYISVLSSW